MSDPNRQQAAEDRRTVIWWGRFDPDYSRNRILRQLLAELGWEVLDFHPRFGCFADFEASLHRLARPDLVWVPCFRQRDLAAAARWARARGIPLVFDPLISAFDKQVDERGKFGAGSLRAKKLLAWERDIFGQAALVLADTSAHVAYFSEVLGVMRERLAVVYVGAEETIFYPMPLMEKAADKPIDVLFYGSFIPLQGAEVVVEAARLYEGMPVRWTLLGQGPLLKLCEEKAKGLKNVAFENWLPYEKLPARIGQADVLLGIFGATQKAARVIPNKVYQALACGRAVVTRVSDAYPISLQNDEKSGLVWTPANDARALAERIAILASDRNLISQLGNAAAATSNRFFSSDVLKSQLIDALEKLPDCASAN